jgi:hypothetical protein
VQRRRHAFRRVAFALTAVLTFLFAGASLRVFAAALILAFVVRACYAAIRRRARPRVLSGWIFVIALGLLVTAAAGSPGRRVRRASSAAVRQGVVPSAAAATPRDRCVGVYLDWWDKDGASQNPAAGWTKTTFRVFATRLCARADTDHVLRDDGSIESASLHRLWYAVGAEMLP